MTTRLSFVSCCVVLFALDAAPACRAADAAIPEGFTHIRTDHDISEYRLDSNGLTVLLQPDHSAPAVSVLVTYHVGSRNESYGTTGATHLLEHMMFKGTTAHNKEAGTGFDQTLERTGAITNATTSQDRTNYFETVGSQDLPLAIEIEADRLRNLRLREEDRRPEMTVVRNEYERGENSPAEALEKEIWATAFLAHPYHHSTIGWRSDFEKVPIEKLRAFYDTFYWPNNTTVTISGDADPATALKLVKQYYGRIPRSPQPIPEVYTEEPPQTGPRRVTVKRPGELGIVTIAQKMPPATHADYPALSVLSEILSDGRNSRFYQALTDKNLTIDVDATPAFNRDPSLFIISAQLATGAKHADVEKRLLDETRARAKKWRNRRRSRRRHFQADGQHRLFARWHVGPGRGAERVHCRGRLAVVLPCRRSRAARDGSRRRSELPRNTLPKISVSTGWFIPQDEAPAETLPPPGAAATSSATASSPPAAAAAEKSSGASAANQSKSPTAPAPAPKAPPTTTATPPASEPATSAAPVAKIAPRIARTKVDGIDLLVCPTGVKDVVTITGSFPAFDPADPVLGDLAADMLERGTKKNDARAIATILDKVGAQIQFSSESGNIKFDARLLEERHRESDRPVGRSNCASRTSPRTNSKNSSKQKIAEAQQSRVDTDVQAGIAFRRAVYAAGHPLYRQTSDETIAKLKKATVDQVKAFHEHWFGPEQCLMVVVGDADPAVIQKQVATAFDGWTGGHALPKTPAAVALKKSSESTVAVPGKESVSVVIGEPLGLHPTDDDYLPLLVGTSALGHGFTSRLVGKVRDTEGLTYGITAGLSGSGQLDRAWIVDATFAPSLLKQGLVSTHRELDKWQHDGITAAEFDYRKNMLAGEHNVNLSTTTGLAEAILDTVRNGLELSWIDDYPQKVATLSLDQINNVIHRRVDPGKLVTVKAGTVGK